MPVGARFPEAVRSCAEEGRVKFSEPFEADLDLRGVDGSEPFREAGVVEVFEDEKDIFAVPGESEEFRDSAPDIALCAP